VCYLRKILQVSYARDASGFDGFFIFVGHGAGFGAEITSQAEQTEKQLGYNDHGYIQFTAITVKFNLITVCWSRLMTVQL
jgi:hypothetical protein